MALSPGTVDVVRLVAEAAADKLGTDIVAVDVSEHLAIADAFVLVTGNNERQVAAIVDNVDDRLRAAGHRWIRREGERQARWVLLDYGDMIVHVMHTEERGFYQLERLWRDCPEVDIADAVREGRGEPAPAVSE